MDDKKSQVDAPSKDFNELSASFASDCKIQAKLGGKEGISLDALGKADDQATRKEQAIKLENVEEVMDYLCQAIEDNDALLHRAAEVLRPGVPAQDIINLAEAICAELKLAQENSPYPEVRLFISKVLWRNEYL
ncbi:uncharacterized protein MELLADRAFT_113698 [Melampsora larici-populina 98AG31]|uniref:Uncharacterized protein n=1 Tax=Melampsora larici-populina (strain 98AG31 / pathotype 3-4-7) TaxID=747676 RepID=F4SAT0_MELLP|nr:uncharacterized protein MELLADRAFT_113698 [Melampsora larici-populina 98AG31]EGF98218.1 hypothetical protein MELLADRAFT_113698 [Melampsora larici-populina 98AG31]